MFNLDVPSDIKFIIITKIRKTFGQEMKVKQSLPFDGKSLYALNLEQRGLVVATAVLD